MTEYEIRKVARLQAEYLAEALKQDDELLDLMFPPKCMNIEEASEYVRIPVSTLYQKINEIPHRKIGKRLVFTDRALTRWMNRQADVKNMEIPMRKVMGCSSVGQSVAFARQRPCARFTPDPL